MRNGLLVLTLLLAACSTPAADGDDPEPASDDQRLAQAICTDLDDGLSLFQIHSQAVEYYRETGRSEDAVQLASAELQDLATREYCPAYRDEFEATITYEQWVKP